mmetsp:Transcript_15392/g.33314  ORF Transcript_15392/g.33314 Transcript_15392/m.33314 type:complete len:345 (-) Transcript_15392:855-1889(-)
MAAKQNSFNFLLLAKCNRASMRTTMAFLGCSPLGKCLTSRQLSPTRATTAMFGLEISINVLKMESTKPTASPSLTVKHSDTTKVASITTNSRGRAAKVALNSWRSMTASAPWMMIGAIQARGMFSIAERKAYIEPRTSTDAMALVKSEVAPKETLTAVLEKPPVTGKPDMKAEATLARPSPIMSWLGSKSYLYCAANFPPTATVSKNPIVEMTTADTKRVLSEVNSLKTPLPGMTKMKPSAFTSPTNLMPSTPPSRKAHAIMLPTKTAKKEERSARSLRALKGTEDFSLGMNLHKKCFSRFSLLPAVFQNFKNSNITKMLKERAVVAPWMSSTASNSSSTVSHQ